MKHIIANFHGPLFSDTHAGGSWAYTSLEALKDSVGWKTRKKALSLALAAPDLYNLLGAYEKGELGYDVIYKTFNEKVLPLLPVEDVKKYLDQYAARPKTQAKLNKKLIEAIAAARDAGARCSILSTGCDYTIGRTIDVYTGHVPLFDQIVANQLVAAGKGSRFDLNIYTPDERRDALLQLMLPGEGYNTVYLGHDEEEMPCISTIMREGGRVIITAGESRFVTILKLLWGDRKNQLKFPQTTQEMTDALML